LLQRLRAAAGLSQEELAKRAGLSRRGISDLERGARRTPYPATVRRLSGALGLGLGERAALLAAAHGTPTGAMPIQLEAEALTIDSQQPDLRTTWGTRVVDAELRTPAAD
jgi:transcriptional regulator with XRE-family HTH domain